MAQDNDLAGRIRRALAGRPAVRERAMFGGLAFMVNGRLAVSAHPDGTLLLKVDPRRADELVGDGRAGRGGMGGRTMGRGWLVVPPEHLADDAELGHWVGLALAYTDGRGTDTV